jgi:hypothetical protein
MSDMILVWRARPSCGGPWLYDDNLKNMAALIEDGASEGDSYELEAVEVTNEAWAEMPDDFAGW